MARFITDVVISLHQSIVTKNTSGISSIARLSLAALIT